MQSAYEITSDTPRPSLVQGATSPPLLSLTLGDLLDQQTQLRSKHECLVCPSLGTRWTYGRLQEESVAIARGLQSLGVKTGDRIGILAGNCAEYISVFFAAGYIGCVLVVLNNTYTTQEATNGLKHAGCRVLFTVPKIGRQDVGRLLSDLGPTPKSDGKSEYLENIIMLRGTREGFMSYDGMKSEGRQQCSMNNFEKARTLVNPDDVVNLQFTSGSTGSPKAAMLTHFNLINNANSIGDRLAFTHRDILCCPPPLFHCFGLVLGVLAVITHGAKVILPAETFDPVAVLRAISDEKCTALHGVPTMFEEILNLPRPEGFSCENLRTGIIAGAPVPRPLMRRLLTELGMREYTSSYGLTETSPTCFNAYTYDTIDTRLTTVGQILPHLRAKIIDRDGNMVPQGARGELCISGYSLQKGYWNNPEKTAEVMVRDEEGVLWLKTGDEASFDARGYCSITGRFKDIIIRGGENIYPLEVETRLNAHPSISRAVVVGIPDSKYGEVVGAFLDTKEDSAAVNKKISDAEVREWTRKELGWHKAPHHVFWFGEEGLAVETPKTGSGKVQKFKLREEGIRIVNGRSAAPRPKL
ncbi:long-chain-fatty-acid- ligase protein [Rutstroemia sp. NJR-2017a WRK4]|nr:long-chain-fatty-acid- ligase protein [Rutstroemia sp. NJR-2017a WRK4]